MTKTLQGPQPANQADKTTSHQRNKSRILGRLQRKLARTGTRNQHAQVGTAPRLVAVMLHCHTACKDAANLCVVNTRGHLSMVNAVFQVIVCNQVPQHLPPVHMLVLPC